MRVYLSLILKDYVTHIHGLAVYVKEGLAFVRDLPLENSQNSYLCFWPALIHSESYLFFVYWSSPSSWRTLFDAVSSNTDEVVSISPTANVFVSGDFSIHHENWLTCSGGTGPRPGELCYGFSISNYLRLWVLPNCDSHSFALTVSYDYVWIYFSLRAASICSLFAFLPLGNSNHVVVSFSIDFPAKAKGNACFRQTA